jgi:hypothetical protein
VPAVREHNGHFTLTGSPAQLLSDVDVVGTTSTSLNLSVPPEQRGRHGDSRDPSDQRG